MAISVVFCLTAHGSTQSGAEGTDGGTTAGTGTVWKIDGIGPVTDSAAVYGTSCRDAQELAVEEINAASSINGYPVVVKYDDDEHDAEEFVNTYSELKDWDMWTPLGTPTSGPCIQVSNESVRDNPPQLTPYDVVSECIMNPNSFAVCFSSARQGGKPVTCMKSRMGGTKIGVFYDTSDAYSSGIRDSFAENAERLSFSIIADEQFTVNNKTDFTVQLQNPRNVGADVVSIPFHYAEAAFVLQQSHVMGHQSAFLGCDVIDGILNVDGSDKSPAEGPILLTPSLVEVEDVATQHFTLAYCEKYHEAPDRSVADACDGIYATKVAAEKANITPAMSASEINNAMEQTMTEIRSQGVTGTITWSVDGVPSKELKVVTIQNGVYQIH